MASEEQHFYDASDAVSIEGAAVPEDSELPPVDPLELEANYLLGASFPASKHEVVEVARANDAPKRVLDLLNRLEEREYANVTDLLLDVENLSGARRGDHLEP